MLKYPRTQHIEGSRLQKGDHDLTQVKLKDLRGHHLVVEEKVDGANAGISFDDDGKMWLQSRGHFLRGGPREKQWDLFKTWASSFESELFDRLENRYVMYGEWLYAKHTVFYDALPHYFLEFDLYDKEKEVFLSTRRRREILAGSPVHSVPVVFEGEVASREQLESFIAPSLYKTPEWESALREQAERRKLDPDRAVKETDGNNCAEGLYIKDETEDLTIGRYKYVRFDFLSAILDSESHWHDRPIIPNQLRDGATIYDWRNDEQTPDSEKS